jgi:hypothetical protein
MQPSRAKDIFFKNKLILLPACQICRSFHFLFSKRHYLPDIDVPVEFRNPAGNFTSILYGDSGVQNQYFDFSIS